MKIGILLFETFHGKQHIGSSRIRGRWLCKHWPEAEPAVIGQKYDVLIFQKTYWIEYAEKFPGLKILDICDPDWLHWSTRLKQMIDVVDGVSCSTLEVAKFIVQLTDKPVHVIPDRLDFTDFGQLMKKHQGPAKIAAWFGYSENFPMLDAAISSLVKLNFEELVVIASKRRPYELPPAVHDKLRLTNLPWSESTVYQDLLKADVVLNPQLSFGRWAYKSNNKTLTAWALGLPVAQTKKELESFLTAEARQAEGDLRYAQVREQYDVRKSVADYQQLIAEIQQRKNLIPK